MKEAAALSENANLVMEKFSTLDGPGLVKGGKSHMKILFGSTTKERLDDIRNTVVPTIARHHMLKSSGRDISFAVDVIEKIKGERDIKDIDALFHSVFRQVKGPKIGDEVTLEHIKPASHTLYLEGAKVKKYTPPYIKLKRYFTPRGYYDGLNVKKESGDYGITDIEEGVWHFRHSYYDRNNNLKGEYFNICTPVEIFPNRIRYIDLEIDVIRHIYGEMEILDEDLLDKRVAEGIFPQKIADRAKQEAHFIIDHYRDEIL